MPYIKPRKQYEKTRKLLNSYEIGQTQLMAILGCSRPTAQNRIENPGNITGDEWLTISRRAHIPVEEIRLVFLS